MTRPAIGPLPGDVCYLTLRGAPDAADLQLAAQIACFENRRNENNGFRVYRSDKSLMNNHKFTASTFIAPFADILVP